MESSFAGSTWKILLQLHTVCRSHCLESLLIHWGCSISHAKACAGVITAFPKAEVRAPVMALMSLLAHDANTCLCEITVYLQGTLLVCSRLFIKLSAQLLTNIKFTSDHGNVLFYPCWGCLLECRSCQPSLSSRSHQGTLTFCRL